MVRLTVNLPGDLVDRVRNAVYWSPSLKLSWLIAQSLRTSLAEMESLRQGPFPQRKNPLRAGRPRMVGQTMKLFPRARLTRNGAARSTEGGDSGHRCPTIHGVMGYPRIVSPSLGRHSRLSSPDVSVASPAKSLFDIHRLYGSCSLVFGIGISMVSVSPVRPDWRGNRIGRWRMS